MTVIATPLTVILTTVAIETDAVSDHGSGRDNFRQHSSRTSEYETGQDGASLLTHVSLCR
jgi:hypothetical protein